MKEKNILIPSFSSFSNNVFKTRLTFLLPFSITFSKSIIPKDPYSLPLSRPIFVVFFFSPRFVNLNATQLQIGKTVWFSQSEVVLHSKASNHKKICRTRLGMSLRKVGEYGPRITGGGGGGGGGARGLSYLHVFRMREMISDKGWKTGGFFERTKMSFSRSN